VVVHFSSQSALPDKIKHFKPKDAKYFERKFKELYSTWVKKPFGYQFECQSILFKIMTKIERELAEIKISDSNDRILEAVEYMHDHFADKEITVDELASMCAMSDTYFRKLFVKNFSVTPLRYINNLKVAYAKELFESGYYTVSQIAQKCGFDSIYYFSAFIKRETGKSPSYFMQKDNM
ncbi:MAG: helix-turn-helix transcriptional regulator, partial [Clostridia bacterium]|nr:helix-turn-helix transcriptional regulator [Clostridia bacterium]